MSWGAVIGAGIGAMTGRRDNKQAAKAARREHDWNLEYQQNAQEFEAQQAASAMAFSERMANTQHQREISDLKAAGLNPILSGTGGMGAASPSGVAGHSPTQSAPKHTIIPTSQAVATGAATGMQIERAMAEIKNIEADTRNKDAQNPGYAITQRQAEAATDKLMAETEVQKELKNKTAEEVALVKNQAREVFERIFLSYWLATTEEQRAKSGLIPAQAASTAAQAELTGVEARTMRSLENLDVNELLKAAPALAPFGNLIKSLIISTKK